MNSIFKKLIGSKETKNAVWIIGGKVAQMILSFVVSVLTARYLGPENYGSLNYVLAFVNFFLTISSLGIGSVIIKFFINEPELQGETLGTALVLEIVASLLSAMMIVGIIALLDGDEPTTILIAVLASISLVFQAVEVINRWFQSHYRSKVSSIATLIAYVVTSAYRLILLITKKNVVWFAFATTLDHLCIAAVLYCVYRKSKGPKLYFSASKAKQLLSQSYHYIFSGMMMALYNQTDKLFLKHLLDETAVGHYTLAMQINTMWVFVLVAIIDSISPTIMQLHTTDRAAYLKKNRQLYSIVIYVAAVVAIGLSVLGTPMIRLVYGTEYVPASAPLKIAVWSVLLSHLSLARNVWIVCENKQKYLKYLYLFSAVLNIPMNLILIPLLGSSGAALSSLLTQMMSTVVFPALIPDMRSNIKLMFEALVLKDLWKKKKMG